MGVAKFKKIFLFTVLLLLTTTPCLAAGTWVWPHGGEITSPFGYRTHPVFGTKRLHTGIDIAADYNEAICAVAPGTVITAEELSGYGNTVIIDHGSGITTYYAHNTSLTVTVGQVVATGTIVSLAGSTGYSTGPHLHFEVRESDTPVDPTKYLDGSRVVPSGPKISADGTTFENSDFNEVSWEFDSFFDFAKPMRDVMNMVSSACVAGIKFIHDDIIWLFYALITIDIAFAAMINLFDSDGEDIFNWLFKRIIKYGFILFLITHWGDIIANSLKSYFVYMGAAAAGVSSEAAGEILSDPTFIVQKGAHLVGPIFAYITEYSGLRILFSLGLVIIALILGLGILACFFIIGFQIMRAYLEFYIIAALSVVSIPFGGLLQTKFLAEKGVNALFQVSIKLMIFSFLAVILHETVKNFTSPVFEIYSYLKVLLVSMLFVLIGNRITSTINKVFRGAGPSF